MSPDHNYAATGPGRNGRSQNGNRQSRTSFVQLWPGWGDLVNVGAIDRIYVYSTDGVARNYAYQVPLLDDSVLGFEAFGAVFGFVKSVYEPAKLLSARSLPTFVGLAQMLGMASAPVGSKPRRRGHRSLLKTAKFQPRLPIDHSAWRHKPLTLRGPKNGGRRLGQGHQRRLDRAWVRPQ